ncbi:c-type cytochrome [Roseicyclus amphidinii]|uniref:c-type cytochrome n=1 Tax=Roseicyclus amphidinii TaxID=3034232 RepID=UPI0024E0D316|nr:c-type cytochrome [Roseicyclus sp. Amp-Y-6]
MKTLVAAPFVLGLAMLAPATAQENPSPDTMEAGPPASGFRTFAPSDAERMTFSTAGEIPHREGEAIYRAICAGCHMPDGTGAVGAGTYPTLADNALLEAPAYPIYLVLKGQAAMPPLGGVLDDAQIAEVVNYIRSHFGNDFVGGEFGAAMPEDVAAAR